MEHPDVVLPLGHSCLSLEQAANLVRGGGVLAYPTETFFGVGCKVSHVPALQRVYAAKQRPLHLPLPVLGACEEQLHELAFFDAQARHLGAAFWPGPLTLLLPARPCVSELVTAGTGRVALRISSHPTACALAREVDSALVASSANVSGQPAVTCYGDLSPALLAGLDGVLAQGPLPEGGLPSTLVELLGANRVRVRRAGAISAMALCAAGCEIV